MLHPPGHTAMQLAGDAMKAERSSGGWACRLGEMFAVVAARAEGGADASEGGEGAQRRERRRLVFPRPNVSRGRGK